MHILLGLKRAHLGIYAIAAVLTGCSAASQGASSLPASYAGTDPLRSSANANMLLALEASGELPGPVPRQAFQWQLQHIRNEPRPRAFHGDTAKVAMWASYIGYSELLGLDRKASKVLVSIDTFANNCLAPNTVKVDHNQNIWIACNELNAGHTADFGGQQEYSRSGKVERSYVFDASRHCGRGYRFCGAGSWDGGWDNKGHVFAELSAGVWFGDGPDHYMSPGFYWWNSNDPSGPGTFIRASHYCKPFCNVYYMDTDSSGNIWFDFADEPNPYGHGGLGEVTNPTSARSVKIVLPAGTYGFPGGVYVSGHGTVLNVTDQNQRETYQYHLPVTPSSTAFNVLGLTVGLPVSGGFNKTESAFVLGNYASGLINIGKLPVNRWSTKGCGLKGYESPCTGAAFTPSDK